MLEGREIDMWMMGIVGLFFLGLFDGCILRAFFERLILGILGFDGVFDVLKFFIYVL